MTIAEQIHATALRYGMDPSLALEVAHAESSLNQNALSPKGAIGVFQLMPGTASALGVNPHNLEENIEGGIRYLRMQLQRFGGNLAMALAAYNWGPEHVAQAVAQWGQSWVEHIPAETLHYVAGIGRALSLAPTARPGEPLPAATPPLALALLVGLGLILLWRLL